MITHLAYLITITCNQLPSLGRNFSLYFSSFLLPSSSIRIADSKEHLFIHCDIPLKFCSTLFEPPSITLHSCYPIELENVGSI